MMIRNFIASWLFLSFPFSATSIYDIEVETMAGSRLISFAQFKGSKLLITTVPLGRESKDKINNLSSLIRSDKNLRIVAIPSTDEDQRQVKGETVSLNKVDSIGMLVTKPVKILKRSGYDQHPLFKWLTNAKLNGHFEADRENTGEYFLIDNQGSLYAVFPANVPMSVLEVALKNGSK